jgi:hypothetical protein
MHFAAMLVTSDCYVSINNTGGMLKTRYLLPDRRFDAFHQQTPVEATESTPRGSYGLGPLDHGSDIVYEDHNAFANTYYLIQSHSVFSNKLIGSL